MDEEEKENIKKKKLDKEKKFLRKFGFGLLLFCIIWISIWIGYDTSIVGCLLLFFPLCLFLLPSLFALYYQHPQDAPILVVNASVLVIPASFNPKLFLTLLTQFSGVFPDRMLLEIFSQINKGIFGFASFVYCMLLLWSLTGYDR